MSLTKADLKAIKDIVDDRVEQAEVLMGQGFNDAYEHLDDLKQFSLRLQLDVADLQQSIGRLESSRRKLTA